MSLLPVGLPMVAAELARQNASKDEQGNLFDLLLGAAAMHFPQASLPTSGNFGFAGDPTVIEPPIQAVLQSSPLPNAEPVMTDGQVAGMPRAPEISRAHEMEAMPRSHVKANDTTYLVQHGTLPVFVAGQLVELTLLRERRLVREAVPTRRLSMTLEAPVSGSVKVGARVEGESLLISFESAVTPETATRESYARELAALARRLGWTFTQTRWKEAE